MSGHQTDFLRKPSHAGGEGSGGWFVTALVSIQRRDLVPRFGRVTWPPVIPAPPANGACPGGARWCRNGRQTGYLPLSTVAYRRRRPPCRVCSLRWAIYRP